MFFVLAIIVDNDKTIYLFMAELLIIAIYIIEHSRLRILIAYVPLMLIVSIDISENFKIEIFDASIFNLLTITICISHSELDN